MQVIIYVKNVKILKCLFCSHTSVKIMSLLGFMVRIVANFENDV